MTPSPRSRRWDYDLLRVGSMVGVVYLHCAAAALRSASGAVWHFANLASSLATAAVPLFFMLSGALLLSQEGTADLSACLAAACRRYCCPWRPGRLSWFCSRCCGPVRRLLWSSSPRCPIPPPWSHTGFYMP